MFTVFRTLVSAWIVFACMSINGFKHFIPLTDVSTIASLVATVLGIFGASPLTLFLPSILFVFLGILGFPDSWLQAIIELFQYVDDEYKGIGLVEFFVRLMNTACKVIIPFWPFQPETCVEYKPTEHQIAKPSVDDEIWIYINGICTTRDVNKANCTELNKIFKRKVYSVHNPTNGVIFDLIECLIGKVGFFPVTIPRGVLKECLKTHLENAKAEGKKKVVLIAHSQGTIITGRALQELGECEQTKDLMKELLHVYLFANCANKMPDENVKYLENISNEYDTVAWLSAFFPYKNFWRSTENEPIDETKTVVCHGSWGHLLNTHYLGPMKIDPSKYGESKLVQDYLCPTKPKTL